jgi:hypothetical protein
MLVGRLPLFQDPLGVCQTVGMLFKTKQDFFRSSRAVDTSKSHKYQLRSSIQEIPRHGHAQWGFEARCIKPGQMITVDMTEKASRWRRPVRMIAEIIDCVSSSSDFVNDCPGEPSVAFPTSYVGKFFHHAVEGRHDRSWAGLLSETSLDLTLLGCAEAEGSQQQ